MVELTIISSFSPNVKFLKCNVFLYNMQKPHYNLNTLSLSLFIYIQWNLTRVKNNPIEHLKYIYIYIHTHTQYKGIKTHKSIAPIIHQEYNRHNNCTKCNHNATEQLMTIICISRVNNNKGDDFYNKIKHDI